MNDFCVLPSDIGAALTGITKDSPQADIEAALWKVRGAMAGYDAAGVHPLVLAIYGLLVQALNIHEPKREVRMNTTKINRIRSALSTQGNSLAEDAHEVIVWTLTLDGPIAIADQASWELVQSECDQHVQDGHTWYSTGPSQFELDVVTDEQEREIANSVARAIRYLSARELLIPHAEFPTLVRASDELKARFA